METHEDWMTRMNGYADEMNKRVRELIQRQPVAAVLGVVAIGFIGSMLMKRLAERETQ